MDSAEKWPIEAARNLKGKPDRPQQDGYHIAHWMVFFRDLGDDELPCLQTDNLIPIGKWQFRAAEVISPGKPTWSQFSQKFHTSMLGNDIAHSRGSIYE